MAILLKRCSEGSTPCPPCGTAVCCLYSAALVHAGTISADDLPAQILFGSITMTKSGSHYTGGGYTVEIYISPFGPTWSLSSDPERVASLCLNQAGTWAPIFATTYHLGGVTLTRSTDCLWTGGGHALYWSATGWGWVLDGHAKTGYQNSPIGTYSGGAVVTA